MTAACGRFGFDQTPPSNDPQPDSAVTPDGNAVAPTGFICNTPQRFTTTGASVAAMTSVSTTTGHVIAMVDSSGNLSASAFKRDVDMLTPLAANLAIDTGITTTITAAASGDNVVIGALYGVPDGTRFYPRDAAGAVRGSAADHVELGTDRALAASTTGQLAFATIDATTKNLEVRKVDIAGNFVGSPSLIVDGATLMPSYAVLQPVGAGYALEWRDSSGFNLALLDSSLSITAGPVPLTSSTGFTQIRPKFAWSPATSTYLVTWHEKNAADTDEVYFQIRAADLSPVTLPAMLDSLSTNPEVIDDDTGFWVTWINLGVNALHMAHVSSVGVVAPRTVTTSGGVPSKWTMLRSGAQPVLVWVETGGSGPDLWIDPMCE